MERVFIDVREPFEFMMGHAEGAVNVPLSQLASGSPKLASVAKDAEVVVYCLSGGRAGAAVEALRGMGYANVVNGINRGQVKATYGA